MSRGASHHGNIDINALCGIANGLVEVARCVLPNVNPAEDKTNCCAAQHPDCATSAASTMHTSFHDPNRIGTRLLMYYQGPTAQEGQCKEHMAHP